MEAPTDAVKLGTGSLDDEGTSGKCRSELLAAPMGSDLPVSCILAPRVANTGEGRERPSNPMLPYGSVGSDGMRLV